MTTLDTPSAPAARREPTASCWPSPAPGHPGGQLPGRCSARLRSCLRARLAGPRLAGLLLALVALATAGSTRLQAGWQAGVARTTITPEKKIWMSGYGGRDHPAEGKLTELWAKALWLEDGQGQRGVVLTLDLVGIDRGTAERVCRRLADKFSLQRQQIAICTSHTHTGPAVGRNLAPLHYLVVEPPQQRLIDEYTSQLEDRLVAVVGEARQDLESCRLAWGSGRCSVAVNRRNNAERDVPQLRADGQLKGPVDHDVPVLAVYREQATATDPKCILFGYACHATVLSFYQWSGDYPGFAQEAIERDYPGCQAMFWAGCGGDQNPLPRRTVELAKTYGRQLADAVHDVVAGTLKPLDDELKTQFREIDLPLGTLPTTDELRQQARTGSRFEAARAKMLLAQIDAGQPLQPSYPYPVGTWLLGGQLEWVTLGGEVVVDYALRLKSERHGLGTWVAGYSHDVMAYIPSRRVLREGGYEGGGSNVYYGLPALWAPELERVIVDEVHRQLGKK